MIMATGISDADLLWQAVKIAIPIFGFGIVLYKLGRVETRNVGPQPFITKKAVEYALHDDFLRHTEANDIHHQRLEERLAALELRREADKEAIISAGEERSRGIHKRIDMLVSAVGQLTGEVKHLSSK